MLYREKIGQKISEKISKNSQFFDKKYRLKYRLKWLSRPVPVPGQKRQIPAGIPVPPVSRPIPEYIMVLFFPHFSNIFPTIVLNVPG